MKLSKNRISKLLENGISKKPLMLHGTSVETVIELFENGVLPTGTYLAETPDHLYFVPVQDRLKGTKFYDEFEGFTVPFAKKSAKGYAKVNAERWYVFNEIKKAVSNPEYAEVITFDWIYGFYPVIIPEEEKQKALRLGFEKIISEAEKRKGVILEMNDDILELVIELDPEDEGLKLDCPNGLDAKYVKGIELLGNEERDIVKKYMQKS